MDRREFLFRSAQEIANILWRSEDGTGRTKKTCLPAGREKIFYRNGVIYCGPDLPEVAITIDDCYDPKSLEKMLGLAYKYKVGFTFFPTGRLLLHSPWRELMKAALELGCEVQNHTINHELLGQLNSDKIEKEIMEAEKTILTLTQGWGNSGRYLRPPSGNHDQRVVEIANRYGLEVVMASLESGGYNRGVDGRLIPSEQCLNNLSRTKRGEIVLLHATDNDADALEPYLEMLGKLDLMPVLLSHLTPSRFEKPPWFFKPTRKERMDV